jgi:hypothetical protein
VPNIYDGLLCCLGMQIFTDVNEQLDAHSYPATTEELIQEYGDLELMLPNGTETLGTMLSRLENQTFDDAEAARLATHSAVSDKAIGRKFYSDRDPTDPGEDGPEPLSF